MAEEQHVGEKRIELSDLTLEASGLEVKYTGDEWIGYLAALDLPNNVAGIDASRHHLPGDDEGRTAIA